MRSIILIISILISSSCFSQNASDSDEMKVKEVVNKFFEALNKQDTVLYKKIVLLEGQIWSINRTIESPGVSSRFFRDDFKAFDPDEEWEETALSFDIKVHQSIAMAWVPYEFKVNGKFTHCGIDIFTLIETEGGWKIINTSYTKYVDGCDELRD